jgi:hypothetical protein
VSITFFRVRYLQIVTSIFTPSLECFYVLFSTYGGNQNGHTGDIVAHTGMFFSTVAYLT